MLTAAVAVTVLGVPASALAAAPDVTTGGVALITQSGGKLKGTVDPNGTATNYIFQFGTTKLYGSQSAPQSAGAGNKPKKVSVIVSSLAPATRYHYRLVGLRGNHPFFGKDRTFKTKRQPLGVSLAAAPNPIRIGGGSTLAGTLSGTDSGGRRVQLQANAWPYTTGFQGGLVNDQITKPDGTFAFTIFPINVNTQYRVLMPAKPAVVSPIVVVGTVAKVTRHAKVHRGKKRSRVRFSGRIRPALDGAAVYIQKRRKGVFQNIALTTAVHTSKGYSRYRQRIRQKHGGRFRIVVVHGPHSPTVSRTIRLRHL
ncbi:MAG TPA: hypothetical protein VFM58_05390 [Solirubrobacteraceae bacterium]|nr:hypothetical protein [Solirubrobacteraceae bacterium]